MRFGKPRKNQKRVNPRYHLNESAKIENNSSKSMHDVQFYLEEFYPFAKEALGFDQDATIVFESDFSNAKNPLGKTAHYDPTNSTVTVYVDKRHPKDVMRSVSHELVHHAQNMRGDLQGGAMEEGYAQTDDHLREMEKEAYTKGNMLFRDWTDSRSNPDSQKDIMARIMQEWGYDETALTEEGGGFEEGQLVTVVASALAIDGEKTGTVVSYEDPAVLIKLDDDQEGKYVPDDKMVKVKKDFVEPRAEAGFADAMGEGVEGVVNPIDFANEYDLDYQTDNEGNVVLYLTQEQGEELWLPDNADNWQVEKSNEPEGGFVIYTNTPYAMEEEVNEMYDDDDFGDDDLDMAALEKEFPWLAKDVKTREAPPEVAADLADEFGDKGEPEDEEEPVEMKEKLSDEEEKEMTDKMSNKEFVKYVTHDKHVRPSIDRERYTEIPGLEGPFQYDSGAILYYDPKAGKYWDRDKDQYLDHEEAAELTMEDTENKNINTTGDSEMNIEEIVSAAVRRALKEKKYRREDEEEKVEETTEEAVTEGATNEEFEKLDAIVAAMGPDEALQALVQALPSHVTHEMLDYIGQQWDIPLGEGATNEEFEKLDAIVAAMGPEEALQALVQALPSHVVHETLDYIGQQYEIPFGDDEVEDFEGFDESKGLSAGQEELDLDDDGKIEPSDLAGLRAGKTDDEVGEEAEEGVSEDVATPVALKGPFDPSQVQSVEDPEYGGMIHTLPNVELTGDLEQDVYDMIGGDEELYSWLWGEMESGDSITDAAGLHVYSGSDVQDHIKAHEESGPGGSHHYQENKSDKEWYDSKLFESLKRKWAK